MVSPTPSEDDLFRGYSKLFFRGEKYIKEGKTLRMRPLKRAIDYASTGTGAIAQ